MTPHEHVPSASTPLPPFDAIPEPDIERFDPLSDLTSWATRLDASADAWAEAGGNYRLLACAYSAKAVEFDERAVTERAKANVVRGLIEDAHARLSGPNSTASETPPMRSASEQGSGGSDGLR